MRRYYIAAVAAAASALFALIVILILSCSLIKQKDNVTLQETVLFGDRTSAENISVKLSARDDDYYYSHMFWDLSYRTGEPEKIRSAFSTRQNAKKKSETYSDNADFITITDSVYTFDDASSCREDLQNSEISFMDPAVEEMISRIKEGQTATNRFFVKDYIDYLPLFLTPEDNRGYQENDGLGLFCIPVPDSMTAEITVTKTSDGTVSQIILSFNGSQPFSSKGIVQKDYCYIALSPSGGDERSILPSSLQGLFRIPIRLSDSSGQYRLDLDDAEKLYPFAEQIVILDVKQSADQKTLFLFTKENETLSLMILDRDSGSLKKTCPLLSSAETTRGGFPEDFRVVVRENSLLVLFPGGKFCLLSGAKEDYGNWQVVLRDRVPVFDDMNSDYRQLYLYCDFFGSAYDGERLAMVLSDRPDNVNSGLNHYLLVYSGDGLIYAGKYEFSLDWGNGQPAGNYDRSPTSGVFWDEEIPVEVNLL